MKRFLLKKTDGTEQVVEAARYEQFRDKICFYKTDEYSSFDECPSNEWENVSAEQRLAADS